VSRDILKNSILKAYKTFLKDIPVKKENKGNTPYLILGKNAYDYLMCNSKWFRDHMIESKDYKVLK